MAEVYEVSNSFRAKDREGNPKVYESKFGTFDVWKVYFTGDEQGYSINKKQGFEGFQKGQKIYGTKDDWRFKQEQMPDDYRPSTAAGHSSDIAEIDLRLKSLEKTVEALVEKVEGGDSTDRLAAKASMDDVLDGAEPVDLSTIPF